MGANLDELQHTKQRRFHSIGSGLHKLPMYLLHYIQKIAVTKRCYPKACYCKNPAWV